jgi:phage-related minor tail protein
MGEAGAEAIMPLRRGRGGKLGVDASRMMAPQGSGDTVFNVTNVIKTPDMDSFRRSKRQLGRQVRQMYGTQ